MSLRLSGVCTLLLLNLFSLQAQIGRGSISGSVADKTDAVIPNAGIQLTHIETNTVTTLQTNGAAFIAPRL